MGGRVSSEVALVLLGALCLGSVGCASDGYRPPTPERRRLLRAQPVPSPPLPAPKARPARAFVLAAPAMIVEPDGVHLFSPVDGPLEGGRTLVWASDAGRVTQDPEAPDRAVHRGAADAVVEARLELRGRVLARSRARIEVLPAPGAVLSEGRLHVDGADVLEWWGEPPPANDDGTWAVDADLVGLRRRDGDLASPWTWVSDAGLPSPASAETVPLAPGACEDPRFPRRAGSLHYGCAEAGRVDRSVPAGRSVPHPLPASARPPASRSSTGGEDLVWAATDAGRWSGELEVRPLHTGAFRGRPAADARRSVFARHDRLEVMERGTSRRTQIPAEPLDGADIVDLWGDRVVLVEGTPAASRLRLRRLDVHTDAVLARGRDFRSPRVTGSCVLLIDDGRPRALPLRGGVDRTWPLRAAADGAVAVLDDWWVVGVRNESDGGDLWAIHLPTGVALPWLVAPGLQSPRGAGAGAITWVDRRADPLLKTVAATSRVFEENGATVVGGEGRLRTGGHGGAHVHLAADAVHRMQLDAIPAGGRLSCFRTGGAGSVTLSRGGRDLEVPLPLPADEIPGWVALPRLGGDVGEPVQVEFRGGPGGLDVDALRLEMGP